MSFERRKTRIGKVISDKMDKSIVVSSEWRQASSLYRKPVRRRTKLIAHDDKNEYRVGDYVRVREGRPISKTKRWRVIELVTREELLELPSEGLPITDVMADQDGPQLQSEERNVTVIEGESPSPEENGLVEEEEERKEAEDE